MAHWRQSSLRVVEVPIVRAGNHHHCRRFACHRRGETITRVIDAHDETLIYRGASGRYEVCSAPRAASRAAPPTASPYPAGAPKRSFYRGEDRTLALVCFAAIRGAHVLGRPHRVALIGRSDVAVKTLGRRILVRGLAMGFGVRSCLAGRPPALITPHPTSLIDQSGPPSRKPNGILRSRLGRDRPWKGVPTQQRSRVDWG